MKRFFQIAAAFSLAAAAFGAAAQSANGVYIVRLANDPVAGYRGNVSGYPATKPAPGAKLNVNASNVKSYVSYLEAQRNNVLAQVGASQILRRYNYAFNGFAARLTPEQARKLKASAGVLSVVPDQARSMDTTRTPAFLGLSTPGGLWSKLDSAGRNIKGEDVIIGIVDGGIWPEDPSFSDKRDPTTKKPIPSYMAGEVFYGPPPAIWAGSCQAGQGFTVDNCNNKLIGAQFFNEGFTAFSAQQNKPLWPTDYVGPRDEDGHGSHTASTAGGNENVDAAIFGSPVGAISGMAPRARIAAYRVCWSYVDTVTNGVPVRKNSCFNSDSVAAIDKAVADGVDVINFSISGTTTDYLDPVEVAFLFAADAGVFVAASAGNEGPGNTVAHMSPWLSTVAASTHDRYTVAIVTLGSGAQFSGPSYQTSGVPSTPLILSNNAGVLPYASLSAANQAALSRCYSAADRADPTINAGVTADARLDPAKVAGKMVVCIRGGNVLVNKGDAVKAAGGVAMIIQNTPATNNSLILQPYVVPTVHLDAAASSTVIPYAQTPGATASFGPGQQQSGVIAPVMASFSSRGPSLADPNILKPDISAPGVDIIAAYVADNSNQQSVHDAIVAGARGVPGATSLQGTSMSSPHVAGSGALLRQAHRDWSPATIKSALMTTTNDIKLANGALDPDRFGYGAGHLNPTPANDPGLAYDAGFFDYLQFLCGVGSLAASSGTCQALGPIAPYNLNLPSLTAANVLGKLTFTRTVTNVGPAATFTATASLPGYSVVVSPSTLALAAGATGSFTVALTRTSAAVGTWVFGNVVWSDGTRTVRSPLTAKGSLLAAAAEVTDTRTVGSKVFTIGTGYDGTLTATPTGMLGATRTASTIALGQFKCFNFVVPANTQYARFALFNADTQGGSGSDLDLYVYNGPNGTGTQVGVSGSTTSEEQVDLNKPPAGTYSACVDGYAPAVSPAAFTLSSWILGQPSGTQTLRAAAPSRVYLGGTASVGVSWSVPAGNRYLGIVQYKDGGGAGIGQSLVSVDVH